MTTKPDKLKDDAMKRLEECKVTTEQDIEVLKKCKKLQELWQNKLAKLDWGKSGEELADELYGNNYALDWGYGNFEKEITKEYMGNISFNIIGNDSGLHCEESMESSLWLPTFEQMIAIIGGKFDDLSNESSQDGVITQWGVLAWVEDYCERFAAPTARQALSIACEFILGGKDLRGEK